MSRDYYAAAVPEPTTILGLPLLPLSLGHLILLNRCESVFIETIVGELNSLVGEKLLYVDEDISDGDQGESSTITVYTFSTEATTVKVTWLGVSNGYYSESVTVTFNDKVV